MWTVTTPSASALIAFSSTTFYACAFAVFVLYWAAIIIRERIFSPLAKIPGPFLWSISPTPRLLDGLLGRGCYTIHGFFQKYGPVVRVEPNLVIFADPKYVKEVYGHQTQCYKTEFYTAFSFDPSDSSAMSTMDNHKHAQRRAFYARPMARPNILAQQHIVQDRCDALVQAAAKRSLSGPIDVASHWAFYTHDVVVRVITGHPASTIEAGEGDVIMKDAIVGGLNGFLGSFPKIYAVLRRVPVESVQWVVRSYERLHHHGHKLIADYRNKSQEDKEDARVMHRMLEDAKSMDMRDAAIINEIFSMIVAGGDTTKWALSYIVYEVFRDPQLKARVQAELDSAMPDRDSTLSFEVASTLPVFTAVCREVLRFWCPIPGVLPRYIPAGRSMEVGQFILPPGTQIAAQPYTINRNKAIYGEDAEVFNADRWLGDAASIDLMSRTLFTFSIGLRRCVGYELAWLELYLGAAAFLRNFDGQITTSTKGMAMRDFYTACVAEGKMMANLERRI